MARLAVGRVLAFTSWSLVGLGAGCMNDSPHAVLNPARYFALGEQVTLDGSRSSDPDNDTLSFAWQLADQPIESRAILQAKDKTAILPVDVDGDYLVQLTVDDGHSRDTAQAKVTGLKAEATAVGGSQGSLLGSAMATGDFNGDTFADLLVGAPGLASAAGEHRGQVTFFAGSANGLAASGAPLVGLQATEQFGSVIVSCDFNGDGLADFAIASPSFPTDEQGLSPNGKVLIIYGNAGGDLSHRQLTLLDPMPREANDRFGAALACASFDNDGYDDLLIGAPGRKAGSLISAGAVYLYHGGSQGLDEIAGLAYTSPVPQSLAFFGASLTVGDFNGDGRPDFVAGAPHEPFQGMEAVGAAYVFHAPASGPPTLTSALALGHSDAQTDDLFGTIVANVGDLNNDGFQDLAVAMPGAALGSQPGVGAVLLFNGGSSGLSSQARLSLVSPSSETYPHMGFGVPFGPIDLNNDGYDDFLIGSPQDARDQHGIAYLWPGGPQGIDTINHRTLVPDISQGRFGAAFSAGDVDHDGLIDLICGTPEAEQQAGAVLTYR